MTKELWLEFGFVHKDGWHDMCWYNEGRWQQLPYFIKHLILWTLKPNRYFYVRYGSFEWNIRGNKSGTL